ncbi:MAG: hypothetical protein ACTSRK_08290 [Promethearchaeota archaeon]
MKPKKILVLVKAYPERSKAHGSSVCTAGITEDGEWIRIYPIRLERFDSNHEVMKKWTWIEANIEKSDERLNRKESYKVDESSIKLVDSSLSSTSKRSESIWAERNNILLPKYLNTSVFELNSMKTIDRTSIGLIKPKIFEFYLKKPIEEIEVKEQKLIQRTLHGGKINTPDEIGNHFAYKFRCSDPQCKGHNMICEDWEIRESFRKWRLQYTDPQELEEKIYDKYQKFMEKRDLYFILGTTNPYNKWVIIGLYYPPKRKDKSLNGFLK